MRYPISNLFRDIRQRRISLWLKKIGFRMSILLAIFILLTDEKIIRRTIVY